MYKVIQDNNLRTSPRTARPAFSLAEMVVAMGVLVLMLTLAGQVFSLTVKSTGQATALVHLNQGLRSIEETIRADLRGVYAGQSVMVIQGNPINAYWTSDDREGAVGTIASAGYVHDPDPERDAVSAVGVPVLDIQGIPIRTLPRADMLMMFTNRKGRSFVDPEIQSDLQQVVYGHAEAGEYVLADPPDPTAPFVFQSAFATGSMFPPALPAGPETGAPFPSQQWHLARRSVQLISTDAPELVANGKALDWSGSLFNNGRGAMLADPNLLSGAVDVVVNFDYESLVLHDTMPENDKETTILDWRLPWVFGSRGLHANQAPFKRSIMDTTPPPLYANRLGHYLLANCASFKVEWSLNPRSDFVAGRLSGIREILWVDPGHTNDPVGLPDPMTDDALATIQAKMMGLPVGDPTRVQLDRLLNEETRHADGARYSLTDRLRSDQSVFASSVGTPWTPLSTLFNEAGDQRANTHVFTATRPVLDLGTGSSTGFPVEPPDYVPDDVFPSALRITIDLYDPQQRLDKPTRHVIIATIGG
jgi:type II secretory pathway pseudopilin PulG